MKFKNIEDVWAYAKNKLVNAQISNIQRTGSSKFFDLTIPKSMVKKFPEGAERQDLNYTITSVGSMITCFLENNGWENDIYDTSDFFDAISGWCGINESQQMNQNAIISVESSSVSGFDKSILFSYYTSRAELEKQLKKLGKPYKLDVYPSDEAEVHVKNSDVEKFKNLITALKERYEMGANMSMMEGFTIKGRALPDHMKADFTPQEQSFINGHIGNKWYQITQKSKVWKDAYNLMDDAKVVDKKTIDGILYILYEAPKGTKFIFMNMGMGAECLMFGETKINESEDGDKYKEFFENKLKQYGVSSPAELSEEDKKKFFTEIRNEWKQQKVNESQKQDEYRKFFEEKLKKYNVSSPAELTQEDRSKFFTEIRNEWKQQKMNEAFVIKGRAIPDKMKSDFEGAERKYIDEKIGSTWYQITPRSKVYKDATALMSKSKKIESKNLGWFKYDLYQAPKGTQFLYASDGYGADAFMFGDTKINESLQVDGYEVLDQAEFRSDFAGAGNFASFALQAMYNPRLMVKCTPSHPNYARIKAWVEALPEVPANENQNSAIRCFRQTWSNMIIIYGDNIYWAYNTGTNLQLLNEAELMKGIGKVFDTLSDRGTMSDNAVRSAIEALGGTMAELSVDPTTNSIKAYKACEDEYQCLIGELAKRGLNPINR